MHVDRKGEGFTLVELMVVVLVIGILVAVAIPIYRVARGTAGKGACQNNLRVLDGAVTQWTAQNADNDATTLDTLAGAAAVLADPTPAADGTSGWYVKDWVASSECPIGDENSVGGDASYTITDGNFSCPNALGGHAY